MFAAITAVFSQIILTLPFSPVPATLQVFAVSFSAVILGKKFGALSQITYLLVGVIGLPVFAGFESGLGTILGPKGGYLISFPIMAYVIGLILEHLKEYSRKNMIFAMAVGQIICYSLGASWLSVIHGINISAAIKVGILPFIVFDAIKIVAAAIIGYPLKNALVKAQLNH